MSKIPYVGDPHEAKPNRGAERIGKRRESGSKTPHDEEPLVGDEESGGGGIEGGFSEPMDQNTITQTDSLLAEGMDLSKCRKCQCMKDALDTISTSLRSPLMSQFAGLKERTDAWVRQMEPIAYT